MKKEKARKRGRPSLSADQLSGSAIDAARWLAVQDAASMRDAAKRFGISTQAAWLAWKRLGMGEVPRTRKRREQRNESIARIRNGALVSTVAAELGVTSEAISRWCYLAGVKVPHLRAADPSAVDAGLDIVRAGGSVSDGASVAGVQYAAFRRYMTRHGVPAAPLDRDRKKLGRSEQAATLVDREGVSQGAAAMIVGVSPGSVRSYMRRRAL